MGKDIFFSSLQLYFNPDMSYVAGGYGGGYSMGGYGGYSMPTTGYSMPTSYAPSSYPQMSYMPSYPQQGTVIVSSKKSSKKKKASKKKDSKKKASKKKASKKTSKKKASKKKK